MNIFQYLIVFEDGTSAKGSWYADTKKEVYQGIIDSPLDASESMVSIKVTEERGFNS